MKTTTLIKEADDTRLEKLANQITMVVAAISAIFITEIGGLVVLKLFNKPSLGFILNFIFGFGILTGIAFIGAIIQELFDDKGEK